MYSVVSVRVHVFVYLCTVRSAHKEAPCSNVLCTHGGGLASSLCMHVVQILMRLR